jgi:hypothetical protein
MMVYLDTSVALAQLLAEDQTPPPWLWSETLVSSRLLQYELWTRVNARGLTRSHQEPVQDLLSRIAFVELAPPVLSRALEPFPAPVRTLDALHLASADFLRARDPSLRLASYDDRLCLVAHRLGIELCELR